MNPPDARPADDPAQLRSAGASCHGSAGDGGAGTGSPIIALVGAPNVGKSSLFNGLTGARATVGNWPGTTVDVGRGTWSADPERPWTLIDLPGAYSLDPVSPDEALTRDLALGGRGNDGADVVILVADAARLHRSLYLVAQLREAALRVVVALTMGDVAHRRGIRIDTARLGAVLGVPVVALDPRRGRSHPELAEAIRHALEHDPPAARTIPSPAGFDGEVDLALEDDRFAFVDDAVAGATRRDGAARRELSDRVDAVVLRPVVGPLVFLSVMWLVFQVTTTIAAPIQQALAGLVSGPARSSVGVLLGPLHLSGTWVEGLIGDGLVAGVGMLLTFVPLMALMFALLALLEDSGYLARAAVVTDRTMRRIGLPGQAFLPLVVAFGCNVPAIAATRILRNNRQRVLVGLLIPFAGCSARLTVFALVGTTFFGAFAGTAVFGMYLGSILLVVGVGRLLRVTLWRTMGSEPLLIDLPPYQLPTLRLTAGVTWMRLRGFLRTAGGIIVASVCAVWFLQAVPVTSGHGFGDVPVEDSAYAAAARVVAPVFEPAGFGDWRTTSTLMVGFVAKEAVVSSWAQTYALEDGGSQADLGTQIIATFDESSDGHRIPAVLAFLAFLLAYTPCVATLAAQVRELGRRWALFGLVLQLGIAWSIAVVVFQVGRWLT